MKRLLFNLSLLFCLFLTKTYAQPTIQWQRSLGGAQADNMLAITRFGTGYVVAGTTFSPTIPNYHGGNTADIYLTRLNSAGQVINQRAVGGGENDNVTAIEVVRHLPNAYVTVGNTLSASGDRKSPVKGSIDAWIVLHRADTVFRERGTGGSNFDGFNHVIQTPDSGFLAVGSSLSTSAQPSGDIGTQVNRGGNGDAMVCKFDKDLNLQWLRLFGGTGADAAVNVVADDSTGYVIAGNTTSNDFNVSGNHGGTDVWLFKISATGTFVWQKCYGGTGEDRVADLKKLPTTEGYILGGSTTSNNGDVLGNNGTTDGWFLKTNLSGVIQKSLCLGGLELDNLSGIVRDSMDKGVVLVGSTTSTKAFLPYHGKVEYAVYKLDSNLQIKWKRTFGGTADDNAAKVIQALDGGFAVVGSSTSRDGNVHFGDAASNGWLIKLNRRNLSFYDDRQLIVRSIPNNPVTLNNLRIKYKARDITGTDTTCTNIRLWQIDSFPIIIGNDTLDDIIEVTNEIKNVAEAKSDPNYNSEIGTPADQISDIEPRFAVQNCGDTTNIYGTCRPTERSAITIAFIDSGIDSATIAANGFTTTHAKLNKYLPSVAANVGYDFVNNDRFPNDENSVSHGTHVAGITARMLDYYGIANTRFMILKTQAADGRGSLWNICRALDFAVCRQVPIINVSLAYVSDSTKLDSSVVKSLMEIPASPTLFRSLFVVAAGNEGLNVDALSEDITCPVRFNTPNMVTVAAIKCNRDSAKFTNYGATSVDISAQGVGIWSTIRGRRWGALNGTSMATPFVTATAALAAASYSSTTVFDHVKVKNNVLSSRQLLPLGSFLRGTTVTGGVADACSAISSTATKTLPISVARVSPNPFSQTFTIEADNYSFDTPLSIAVYSIGGQLMQQHRLAPTFNASATVNAQNLPMGIYLVKIQTKDRLFTAKIVKSE